MYYLNQINPLASITDYDSSIETSDDSSDDENEYTKSK